MKKCGNIFLGLVILILVLVYCTRSDKETNAYRIKVKDDDNLPVIEEAINDTRMTIDVMDQLKCLEVIIKHVSSQLNNDFDSWQETLTDKKKLGFSKEANSDFGIIAMEINRISFLNDSYAKDTFLNSDYSKEMGWNNDDVIVVRMDYYVEYDHTKVPFGNGPSECEFILVKKSKDSSWFIEEWINHSK